MSDDKKPVRWETNEQKEIREETAHDKSYLKAVVKISELEAQLEQARSALAVATDALVDISTFKDGSCINEPISADIALDVLKKIKEQGSK